MNTYLGTTMVKVRVVLAKYQPKNALFLIILDNTCILCINTTYGSKLTLIPHILPLLLSQD